MAQVRFPKGGFLRCFYLAIKGDQLYPELVDDGIDSGSGMFLSGHMEPNSANGTYSSGARGEISAPGVYISPKRNLD